MSFDPGKLLVVGDIITGVIVAAYAVLLVLYLRAEANNNGVEGFKRATAIKFSLSGLFCATAVISGFMLYSISAKALTYIYLQGIMTSAALGFAFFGDYYLQYIKLDIKKFKKGIGFFMATQILLIANMCLLNKVSYVEVIVTAAVLLLVLLLMKKQNWQLGEEKGRITAYTILLVFMASKAAVTFFDFTYGRTAGTLLFAIGAALFLISDILLGIWNYKSGARKYANLNWITYFSGMLLIALSIGPNFDKSLVF